MRIKAVCYLNNQGKDFNGGGLHFQSGKPSTVLPVAGDVVIYTADSRNIHCVDEVGDEICLCTPVRLEITAGERLALNLWFSRDASHDEDRKLIALLGQCIGHDIDVNPSPFLPLPASCNMYWFSTEEAPGQQSDRHLLELLARPLRLARGGEIYEKEFNNSLHALQSLPEMRNSLISVNLGDEVLAATVFGHKSFVVNKHLVFDWAGFFAAVVAWESYSAELYKKLCSSLSHWISNESIFCVPEA
ncbi:hypothetical protein Sjap_004265 [Stephania japonica]|uniref:Prolyl 4-hydroxylase alpha subunit Fe(2+) 2OG dioxygenase domain-containing protein n=1 Tax=Stephania japonica TaxID=461633 RepID=A0AAP0K444_9MAGN